MFSSVYYVVEGAISVQKPAACREEIHGPVSAARDESKIYLYPSLLLTATVAKLADGVEVEYIE